MTRTKIAIYPGTFDPITYGHIDIIKRASKTFGKVIVAAAHNADKRPLFSVGERVDMLKEATRSMANVAVDDFAGLVVDYARKKRANVMIRGIRMLSDFEYEFQMALTNRKLDDGIETIFLMPHESYSYLSSKLIKEAGSLGADLSKFIPGSAERRLKKKLLGGISGVSR